MKTVKPIKIVRKNIWDMQKRSVGEAVPTDWIKLNANENNYPLPEPFVTEVQTKMAKVSLNAYPNQDLTLVSQGLAHLYGCAPENIAIDNGSSLMLEAIFRTMLNPGDTVAGVVPSYNLYPHLCKLNSVTFIEISYEQDFVFPMQDLLDTKADLIIISNPNNPTGTIISLDQIEHLLQSTRKMVIIDEAYGEFGGESAVALLKLYPHLLVIKTFSKAYSLAGVRVGVGLAHPEIVQNIQKIQAPFHINNFTQDIIISTIKHRKALLASVPKILLTKSRFEKELSELGFILTESAGNFVFVTGHQDNISFQKIFDYLYKQEVVIMYYPANVYGQQYLRISIGTDEEMNIAIKHLEDSRY